MLKAEIGKQLAGANGSSVGEAAPAGQKTNDLLGGHVTSLERLEGQTAVALGQASAVGLHEEWDVGKARGGQVEGAKELQLPSGTGDEVICPQHVGDARGGVVDHHGELVARHAVSSADDEVPHADGDVLFERPLDLVDKSLDSGFDQEAQRGRTRRGVRRAPMAAGTRVHRTVFSEVRRRSSSGDFSAAAPTGVGALRGQQQVRGLLVQRRALRLVPDRSIPFEPEPLEVSEDAVDGFGLRTVGVEVLDAQPEFTAEGARLQPPQQRGAEVPQVKAPRGAGGEPAAHALLLLEGNAPLGLGGFVLFFGGFVTVGRLSAWADAIAGLGQLRAAGGRVG